MPSQVTEERLIEAAASLRRAQASATAIAPLRDTIATLEDAYRVQGINTAVSLSQGRRLVGRKIGLTSHAVQHQLGVDQPDYGMLYADMEVLDTGLIDVTDLISPKMETELAFVVGKDLTHPQLTMTEVLGALEYAVPAIEIVDSRIRDWDISILDTVADNASCGLYVLGTRPVPVHKIDMHLAGMTMWVDGHPASTGATAACLGNPLVAVHWLARTMVALGRPLGPGDLVLSGALGPMVAVKPGQDVEAHIHGAGSVSVHFVESNDD